MSKPFAQCRELRVVIEGGRCTKKYLGLEDSGPIVVFFFAVSVLGNDINL